VLEAGASQDARADAALEDLCRTYWHPIYCFARRRGQGPEDAQDLTQEFFRRLIERRDFHASIGTRAGSAHFCWRV